MTARTDVVVVGLGVMGSAATAALAASGRSVIGLDARSPAHPDSASTGESRMLRRAYPSHPDLGPLTGPAREAWLSLERRAGAPLLLRTGGLLVDRSGGAARSAAVDAARRDGVPHRVLDAHELRRRCPALRFADDDTGFLDEEAGLLLAERCVLALQREAVASGARLRFGEPVGLADLLDRWADRREVAGVRADRLVLALGAWHGAATAWPPLRVERTTSFWFDPGGRDLGPDALPFVEWVDGDGEFCLLPALPGGVKAKAHHTGEPDLPPARPVGADEVARARTRLRGLTGLDLEPRAATASCYANTGDGALVVAAHPGAPDVVVVSACSGHGFKFAPVLADRVVTTIGERSAA
ncbi:FAD-dependent oxidoreductase [Actinosynnema mirum]|uniref:FAD dependent oxidoreductase n=1 Tax=Actinosynnema mirum (strain ATCC 29888 / DSM 43827 / JCM 3225 / NBRC 14064 / NCIMB 13271 / NRRL B-12336 / IMRU 3971 / 101) TaxID=446462 RepID=C6WEJ9_ACTMD|nr:FAD-dependent oxidoreductase [Actinosynnema mirum]ACU37799.1 FAD dependent oxidoreductase [Actinosynnema mirum DSM 43827]